MTIDDARAERSDPAKRERVERAKASGGAKSPRSGDRERQE
jgi:hypothetical protein